MFEGDVKDWLINVLALVGAAVVAYGLWLAYPPAGIVAAGAALILAAVAIARGDIEHYQRTR